MLAGRSVPLSCNPGFISVEDQHVMLLRKATHGRAERWRPFTRCPLSNECPRFKRNKEQGSSLRHSQLAMPLAYAICSAIIGTQSVIQAKCLSELLTITFRGENQLVRVFPFGLFFFFVFFPSRFLSFCSQFTSFFLTRDASFMIPRGRPVSPPVPALTLLPPSGGWMMTTLRSPSAFLETFGELSFRFGTSKARKQNLDVASQVYNNPPELTLVLMY